MFNSLFQQNPEEDDELDAREVNENPDVDREIRETTYVVRIAEGLVCRVDDVEDLIRLMEQLVHDPNKRDVRRKICNLILRAVWPGPSRHTFTNPSGFGIVKHDFHAKRVAAAEG